MSSDAKWRVVVLVMALSACGDSSLPATPLFAGVEGKTYSEGTRLIQDRLEARFPKDSSEPRLEAFLKEQGLRIEQSARASGPPSRVASFKYGNSFCGSQVRVSWTGDAVNKITEIQALYSDTGCP